MPPSFPLPPCQVSLQVVPNAVECKYPPLGRRGEHLPEEKKKRKTKVTWTEKKGLLLLLVFLFLLLLLVAPTSSFSVPRASEVSPSVSCNRLLFWSLLPPPATVGAPAPSPSSSSSFSSLSWPSATKEGGEEDRQFMQREQKRLSLTVPDSKRFFFLPL